MNRSQSEDISTILSISFEISYPVVLDIPITSSPLLMKYSYKFLPNP